jgi:malonyl-CoA/methylmalonyl-CoA synthetase
MTERNLYAPVAEQVARNPDAIAMRFGDRQLSYGDFDRLVAQAARMLIAYGIGPDDHVAGMLAKTPEALALTLGAFRIGAVYVPINPAFTEGELDFVLRDAEPSLVVTDEPAELPYPNLLLSEMAQHDGPAPRMSPGEDTCASMLYTSGTTGRPKGARMSHRNILDSFSAFNQIWQITDRDVFLHVLPTYHAHGLLMATLCPLYAGAQIVMTARFDIEEVLRLLPQVNAMMAVPTVWGRLADHPGFDGHGLRLATSGSAPLSPQLYDRLLAKGVMLADRYGSTEAGMIAANPTGASRRGSVGRVLPGVEMRLADENGAPVQQGEIGRIQARGPHVFLGYWRRPELDGQSATADGWFDTGDFGKLDDEDYLYIVGRDKDMIISGGFNVYPREVELALEQSPDIAEAVVFGVPHRDFGEGVVAALKLVPGASLGEDALRQLQARTLAPYKRPKRLFVVEEFPRNGMGKILRKELALQFEEAFAPA